MSTLTLTVPDNVLREAGEAAAARKTTVEALLQSYLEGLVRNATSDTVEDRAKARKDLVQAFAQCEGVVGDQPTRGRTYGDRRFHRH